MGDGSVGTPNRIVRPTSAVERAESVTDRRPRREQQQQQQDAERRRKEPPNPRRRRVYDLLFEEVDHLDSLTEQQRARVKENIRNHVIDAPTPLVDAAPLSPPTAAATSAVTATTVAAAGNAADAAPPEPDETQVAERLLADPQAEVPVDHDRLVDVAAPVHPHQALSEAEENRILAEQLRLCLSQHSARARKLTVYLHVLLSMNQTVRRPTLMLDI